MKSDFTMPERGIMGCLKKWDKKGKNTHEPEDYFEGSCYNKRSANVVKGRNLNLD